MRNQGVVQQILAPYISRNEKIIGWLRFALIFIVLPDLYYTQMKALDYYWDIAFIAYFFAALVTAYKWGTQGWYKYVVITLDIGIVVFSIWSYAPVANPLATFVFMSLVSTLLIILASLRLSRQAVVYALGISLLSLFLVHQIVEGSLKMRIVPTGLVVLAGILSFLIMRELSTMLVSVYQREKASSFVSPAVANYISQNPAFFAFSGQKTAWAILFIGLRGFNLVAAAQEKENMVSLTGDLYRNIVEKITEQGGAIDKIVGNTVVAVFEGPITGGGETDRAVMSAKNIMREFARLNEERQRNKKAAVQVSIGVHWTSVSSPPFNESDQIDYSPIARAVVSAARLQKLGENYQNKVVISQSTYDHLGDRGSAVEQGKTILFGDKAESPIYSVSY